jgi:serine/threonine protein kinase
VRAGAVIDRRFEVIGPAGTGGMGTVFRARDLATGSEVALKILMRNVRHETARFRREAHLLSRLDHPSIVRFVADGSLVDGTPYMVAEWIEGTTLRQLLNRGLTATAAVDVVSRTAAAVGAAHALGVIHRDLKPDNLMFAHGDPSELRVLDFGIAVDLADSRLTPSGAIIGTPGYMAPEQIRGGAVDARTDVFALGVVLYEALIGRLPFPARTASAQYAKILTWNPPRVDVLRPELSQALGDLVASLLEKSPERRPADGGDVARRLASVTPLDLGRAGAAPAAPSDELCSTLALRVPAGERRANALREASRLVAEIGHSASLEQLPDGTLFIRLRASDGVTAGRLAVDLERASGALVAVSSGWARGGEDSDEEAIEWIGVTLEGALADDASPRTLSDRLTTRLWRERAGG